MGRYNRDRAYQGPRGAINSASDARQSDVLLALPQKSSSLSSCLMSPFENDLYVHTLYIVMYT